MKGKIVRVIIIMDVFIWYYCLVYGSVGYKVIKWVIFGFCGFKVKFFIMGSLKNSFD